MQDLLLKFATVSAIPPECEKKNNLTLEKETEVRTSLVFADPQCFENTTSEANLFCLLPHPSGDSAIVFPQGSGNWGRGGR